MRISLKRKRIKSSIHFIFVYSILVFSSCDKEDKLEIADDSPKGSISIGTRATGDGKNDLLGYGYDCRYALADNSNIRGAKQPIIGLDRFLSSTGINPSTGVSLSKAPGRIEKSMFPAKFEQYEVYGSSYTEFENKIGASCCWNRGRNSHSNYES